MNPKQFTVLIKTLITGFGWVTESNVLPAMWGSSGASRAKDYTADMKIVAEQLLDEALELDPKRPPPLSPDRAAAAAAGADAATLARNAELADVLTEMINEEQTIGLTDATLKRAVKMLAGAGS